MDSRLRGNGGVDIADLNWLYSAGKAHATRFGLSQTCFD